MKLNRQKFDADKITIILQGDEHIGSKYFDEDFHKRVIEWMYKTPNVYMIGMGDNLETATRDSVGAGVFEQDEVVQEQLEKYVNLHQPLADEGKIIGLHRGNHEERVYKHSGLDLTKIICRLLKVKDFGIGVAHYIKVGNQSYTGYTTHGHSGARMPHTKIKTCIDLANMIDVEFYGMGHLHQLSHHVRQFYKVDKQKNVVNEETKHFLLTGSFLTHWGSYAHEAGYEMMRKGSPKLKLSGKEHQLRVSLG